MSAARSVLPVLLLALLGGGCSNSGGTASVRLQSIESGRLYSQTFPHAYYSQSADGDRTVVLIDEGLPREASQSTGPLDPLPNVPLRQVIRFKVLWNPLHGTAIDAPSTTNCIIDWVIRNTGPNRGSDSLRYQGAGFVTADMTNAGLFLTVRSATLDAASHTGNLTDPLGRCTISGKFTAVRNDQLVAATIGQMEETPFAPAP